ncbi:MAG: histidine kinase, partial [Moraxellaceae bacterium]
DKEIKILAVHGTKALNSYTNDELIKNLLYYVARAGKHAPGFTQGSHLKRIYETYNLADALIEGRESDGDNANMLSSPDPEAMRSVVEALKTEINIIKHALDVCLAGGDGQQALQEALPVVKRIADTMAVLGFGELRKQVLEQGAALQLVANTNSEMSNEQLMSIAGKVIEIEDALDSLAQQQTSSSSSANDGDINLSRAKESVLRESRNGLEHAKDAIIEYIASQWDRTRLQNVPETLREIRGGLEIMPLPRAARILGACARYIEEQLLAQEFTPQWSTLDTLADAITSVEYYLERLSGGSTKEENELLLGVAEESVAALGYPVAKTPRAEIPGSEFEAVRQGHKEDVLTTHEAAEKDEANLTAAYESVLQPDTQTKDFQSKQESQLEQGSHPAQDSREEQKSQTEPPNLLRSTAPSIGNHYPRPETTVVVSPAPNKSIEVAIAASAAPKATEASFASTEVSSGDDYEQEEISAGLPIDSVNEPDSAIEDEITSAEEIVASETKADADEIKEAAAIASVTPEKAAYDEEDDIDEEIIEIFVEEAREVSETIAEYFPIWAKNFNDAEALTEFRRAFHTLKGSGRMVGANDIGELAWSIENMLNRVIDKTIEAANPHIVIIEKVRVLLPSMIDAFSLHQPNPNPSLSQHYRLMAESLAKGIVPSELADAPDAFSNEITSQSSRSSVAVEEDDEVYISEEDDAVDEDITADENLTVTELDAVQSEHELPLVSVDDGSLYEELSSDDGSIQDGSSDEEEIANLYAAYKSEPVADTSAAASNDDDADVQLWDIFGAEALTHLQVVEEFIAYMEAEAPCYEPPSDGIQRALHTLKGSAHMAEITPVAELAAPLEKFVKELRSYHVNINDDILQLLRDGVTYTHAGLAQIERGENVEIPRLHQFVARVNELRELYVTPLVRQQEMDEHGKRPVDPELLSIFMAEEMNLLLNADNIIAQWQEVPHNPVVLQPVLDELHNLTRGANHAYLPVMANLGEKLERVYSRIIARELPYSLELCDTLNAAHVALLDMVDAVAAGQNLNAGPETIHSALDAFLAQTSNNVVQESGANETNFDVIADDVDVQNIDLSNDMLLNEAPFIEVPLAEQTAYNEVDVTEFNPVENITLDAAEINEEFVVDADIDTTVSSFTQIDETKSGDVGESSTIDLGEEINFEGIESVEDSTEDIVASLPVIEIEETPYSEYLDGADDEDAISSERTLDIIDNV